MKRIWALMVGALLSSSCSWMITQPDVHNVSKLVLKHSSIETPLPPTFLGHPLAYMAAIFGQLTVFSVAIASIFFIIASSNFKRDRCRLNGKITWKSPVNVVRACMILFMTTVLMGVSGNLLVYLSWNEVEPDTLNFIFTVDKLLKSALVFPFLYAVYLMMTHNEVITMQLAMTICPDPLWPPRSQLKQHIWMILWIFVIALGVTMAKMGEYIAL